jgi:ribonuclease D
VLILVPQGFGLKHDLQRMVQSYPSLNCFRVVRHTVDLQLTFQSLCHDRSGDGLSALVLDTLGRPLDKRQQMSDWELRPLTPQQLHYAACDASVLVHVRSVLLRELGPQSFKRVDFHFS